MKIIEYSDLDTSRVAAQYKKICRFLENDDLRSAEVKKLGEHDLYRARLDDTNRVLFRMYTHNGERCALMLEVVLNHAYDKSRFMRGAKIDEAKIPVIESAEYATACLPELPWLNTSNPRFHLLDKIISFDERQEEIFGLQPPLIIIGPAGSGKTALTLEKLKHAQGQILYVTLSPYLTEYARNLYYAHHYENEKQEISFLSFAELLETVRIPEGREVTFRTFAGWIMRFPRHLRVSDAHTLYEEFRGVITGAPADRAFMGREEYQGLGIRQSIFPDSERPAVYDLFEKYLIYLKENRLYDPNILSHQYLDLIKPSYDLVVADEVQDITNIQLRLILKSLNKPGQFILCGDSNQIVHPNFFSWAGLKSMLYLSEEADSRRLYHILHANFRNAGAITDLANNLLRIKQRRFGSIDRESNYLMNSMPGNAGEVVFAEDSPKIKSELNQKTRLSTRFAVLVMREEDKDEVRQFFSTPLLFSIHEAKGLEYENVILVNFISGQRANFQEIVRGVAPGDLEGALDYMRAKDKSDKSLEIYKFYINALYVAITRAVRQLYIVEKDTGHAMAQLLGFGQARDAVDLSAQQSGRDEWQAEARKLELQGRKDQAEDIRKRLLSTAEVPWVVLSSDKLSKLLDRAFDPREISQKPKKAAFDYAFIYGEPGILEHLYRAGYGQAKTLFAEHKRYEKSSEPPILFLNRERYDQEGIALRIRTLKPYEGKFYKDILQSCEKYGIDHRTPFNFTSLIMAAIAGNIKLAQALMEAGADPETTDNYGLTAWHHALYRAMRDKAFAADFMPQFHELLAPVSLSIKMDDRLIKIDNHLGEFMLIALAIIYTRIIVSTSYIRGITAADLAKLLAHIPDSVIPSYRRKRQYISGLLSRNETESTNEYSRKLFARITHGHYILNPAMQIKKGEEWVSILDVINQPLLERTCLGINNNAITIFRGSRHEYF